MGPDCQRHTREEGNDAGATAVEPASGMGHGENEPRGDGGKAELGQ